MFCDIGNHKADPAISDPMLRRNGHVVHTLPSAWKQLQCAMELDKPGTLDEKSTKSCLKTWT